MKLRSVRIGNFQQFEDVRLDLTYPEGHPRQGEPLSRACLLGTNGTGKSTLLELIARYLRACAPVPKDPGNPLAALQDPEKAFRADLPEGMQLSFEVQQGTEHFHTLHRTDYSLVFQDSIEAHPEWFESYLKDPSGHTHERYQKHRVFGASIKAFPTLSADQGDVVIYCPAESPQNRLVTLKDVPETTLDRALRLFQERAVYHEVSTANVAQCWEQLIYLEKKRENDYRVFEALEENQSKSVREVRESFDRNHPRILESIAKIWDRLLEPAGLMFDFEAAQNPIQLTENLKAYIVLKGSRQRVPYSRLSTGIRNFLFRLGHIHALHFDRQIGSSFLLMDEPENSLYPDFLYDLPSIYQDAAHGAQVFMATHSPILAAQFDPAERFLLRFDDPESRPTVRVERGVSPEGDDPNDLLKQDFQVRSLYGEKGLQAWERYLGLRKESQTEMDPARKRQLAGEYLKLGRDYNFPARDQ